MLFIAVNLSIAVELPLCHPLLSINLESIALELPLRCPSPSTARLFVGVSVAFEGACVGVFSDGAVLLGNNNDIKSVAGEGSGGGG